MNRTITILEDDSGIREICSYIFSDAGYVVNSFPDIASFTAANTSPSIFLLDIMLPDGDGCQLCNELKNDPILESVPVVMMSAHRARADAMSDCRADDFIEKPFDIEQMLQQVGKLVR